MEDITHHAQYAIVPQFGGGSSGLGEPAACPDHDSVSQSAQQHDHLLGLKAFLAALSTAQALMVALKGGLDATATLIIQVYIGKPHGGSIGIGPSCRLGQGQHFPRRERRDQHADAPLLIGLAAAQRKASHGTSIFRGGQAHPADLSPLSLRIIDPLLFTTRSVSNGVSISSEPGHTSTIGEGVDQMGSGFSQGHLYECSLFALTTSSLFRSALFVPRFCSYLGCGRKGGAKRLTASWELPGGVHADRSRNAASSGLFFNHSLSSGAMLNASCKRAAACSSWFCC